MRKIKRLIIHCSATKEGQEYSVDTITKWHKKRGFRTIGYHFLVHLDGSISKGRNISEIGAHCKGYNRYSIGVCYVGGLDQNGKPKDTRTKEQKETLRNLSKILKVMFDFNEVKGHRDYSKDLNGDGVISKIEWMKSCPCFDVKTEL